MPATHHVLVTGASKGIGKAIALYLDQQGYHVMAGVRKEADASTLRAEGSDRLKPIMIDVTKPEMIATAAETVRETVGDDGLYGLVNNAGIAVASPMEFIPMDDLRWQMEVNFFGQIAVIQAMMPYIRMATGRIINITSIAGKFAVPQNGAYSASKFALEAVTDAMRGELDQWGIKSVSILPGAIKTEIFQSGRSIADDILEKLPPQAIEYYAEPMQAGREMFEQMEGNAIPPVKVAEVVLTALTVTNPRPRYIIGKDARVVYHVLRFLPRRILKWLF
ncbi:MAG: SDR family oxidoreductase [Chloroflexota bacterium]